MAGGKSVSASKIAVWIILGLLIIGLAGFGATNFGGTIRSIGTVGDVEIPTQRYANILDQEMRSYGAQIGRPLTMSEARSIGLDQAVLQNLIAAAALENEADRVGISVGDAEIATQIRNRPEFSGLSGDFDDTAYEFSLNRLGLNPREFESQLRAESASSIVQAGVTSGFDVQDTYGNLITGYLAQERSFRWAKLDENDLETPLPEPTNEQLQAFYDADPNAYLVPEQRAITYAWLSPDALSGEIEVDADELRALYDERADLYNQPERRLVERLIYADENAATTALKRATSGEIDFDGLVAERGLDLVDVDMGDVSVSDLGISADMVFALTEPGLVGPVPTDLGPAIFRVNAILSARVTPFEDVIEDLRSEYAQERARRQIENQITDFDDLLAGGATIEELAAETNMELGEIVWNADLVEGIAAYEAFRDAAAAAQTDDFPELVEMQDGGVFALRLDNITASAPEPFDAAIEKVAERYQASEAVKALKIQAETIAAGLDDGADLSSFGVITSVETGTTRDAFIDGTPRDLVQRVFALENGQSEIIEAEDGVFVVHLHAISEANLDDPELANLTDRIGQETLQSISRDALEAFTDALEQEAGISINATALNHLQSQFN